MLVCFVYCLQPGTTYINRVPGAFPGTGYHILPAAVCCIMPLLDDNLILTVSVSTHTHKPIVPLTFIRLDDNWVRAHTCRELLERVLDENGQSSMRRELDSMEAIVMKCFRSIGVQNSLASKRHRHQEEVNATTFFMDTLSSTLRIIESDEISFEITPPPPAQLRPVEDATTRLMRAAACRVRLPPRKAFSRMRGDQNLYNAILGYLEEEGVGWSNVTLPSGTEFLEHVTKAFWVIGPKVRSRSFGAVF